MRYLLDTDVISETAKTEPSQRVLDWLAARDILRISTITVYELARGVAQTSGRKQRFLEEWLARLLDGGCEVLPFGKSAAIASAALEADARRRGKAIDAPDLFILATAKAEGLHVATRNVAHFRGRGVGVYNPFDELAAP